MAKAKVWVQFPKTGLGNMLLVWANAFVFAQVNNLELHTSRWWAFHWGAFWRGESKKRFYAGYFFQDGFLKMLKHWFNRQNKVVVRNPPLQQVALTGKDTNTLYLFDKLVTHEQMFLNLAPYRETLSAALHAMLRDDKKKALRDLPVPEIAVHIRRGDFNTTGQATSLDFFIGGIRAVREAIGRNIPVTVFSDANEKELKPLFDLPAIMMATPKADILDILLMSRSKILLLSQSSSFSYWAAFLSEALVIMKHDDWQEGLKPNGGRYQEIKWDMEKDDLTSIVKKIFQQNLSIASSFAEQD